MVRFESLGVITDKSVPDKTKIDEIMFDLDAAFDKIDLSKDQVVEIIKKYLPNFEHIEKGKSLDSKM